jgi:uncharacterized protein with HEPN domain
MSRHRDDIVLKDIANAAQLIISFIEGFDHQSFTDDWKTRSAVLYQLTVIGEAAKRLSAEYRLQHADISWALMAGMRDHLIHAYDLVDWDEVWKTASSDIPDLLDKIDRLQ